MSLRSYRKNLINVPNNQQSAIEEEIKKQGKEEQASSIKPLASSPHLSPQQIQDTLRTISRFRFFQGKNLTHFEELLKKQDLKSAEEMIAQKFRAQQKHKPQKLAQEVFRKLLEEAS